MPATKVQKLCSNAPAGLQTLNRLADNLESFKTDVELEHTPLAAGTALSALTIGSDNYHHAYSPGDTTDPLSAAPGKHEHPLIARGMAYVAQVTTADPTVITSYGVQLWRATGCLGSMQVLSTGVYFFPITGFSKVWGRATAHVESATGITGLPMDARVYASNPAGAGSSGLIVKTFRLMTVSGHDILNPFHTGFYLLAYGRRQNPAAQPGAQGARSAPFARKPRRFIRFPGKKTR